MDALDLLEQQHREVREVLDRLAAEPSAAERAALSIRAARLCEAHIRVEEAHLYPACAARMSDDRRRIYEAMEEHALLRQVAQNLGATRPAGARFEARLSVLRARFEHHADAEEDWLFPKLKRALTDEQLDVLGVDLESAFLCALEEEPMGPTSRPLVKTSPPLVIPRPSARRTLARRPLRGRVAG
jgi:hemerythrin superfamily protein